MEVGMFQVFLLVALFVLGNAFFPTPNILKIQHSSSSYYTNQNRYNVLSAKPDLFSDDLFDEDDEGETPQKVDGGKADIIPNKKKYLDEDWKLSADDAKDFSGFPSAEAKPPRPAGPAPAVPCFALMYKFRKEYLDAPIDSTLADHKGYCLKFKRLMSSEVINLGKAKGCVLLWAGFKVTDFDETKREIMSFLEEDPLIVKDIVDNWDLIELSKKSADALPPVA